MTKKILLLIVLIVFGLRNGNKENNFVYAHLDTITCQFSNTTFQPIESTISTTEDNSYFPRFRIRPKAWENHFDLDINNHPIYEVPEISYTTSKNFQYKVCFQENCHSTKTLRGPPTEAVI